MADPLSLNINERPRFSFCEGVTATGYSPWHIRELGSAGLKPGGGVDTQSLCGHVQIRFGWDLLVRITEVQLEGRICPRCLKIYREKTSAHTP